MFEIPKHKISAKEAKDMLQKILKSYWLYFGIATLIIFISLGVHTIPQYFELQKVKAQIEEVEEENKNLTQITFQKEEVLQQQKEEYDDFYTNYAPHFEEALPNSENIGELTRFLENFSLKLEKRGTMELNTISYGKTKTEGEYNTLPVRLSFEANQYNFVAFLEMVEKSGSLDETDYYDEKAIRLMSIEKINVSIPDIDTEKEEAVYSVNLEINAYFRLPPTDG